MNVLVPLGGLTTPSRLDGRGGRNRAASPGQLAAEDDRSAVLAWLARYADSPRHLGQLPQAGRAAAALVHATAQRGAIGPHARGFAALSALSDRPATRATMGDGAEPKAVTEFPAVAPLRRPAGLGQPAPGPVHSQCPAVLAGRSQPSGRQSAGLESAQAQASAATSEPLSAHGALARR